MKAISSYKNTSHLSVIIVLIFICLCIVSEVFPEFSEQPQSQVFSHHSPVTLRCAATPEDAQIRWLFNGQPLDERRHTNLIVQGSNLHFSYIHRHADQHSDLGEYRCTATTSLGTVISQPAILSKPGEYIELDRNISSVSADRNISSVSADRNISPSHNILAGQNQFLFYFDG